MKEQNEATQAGTDDARARRNAYAREYYKTHKEQIKAIQKRCAEKKRSETAAKGPAFHAVCPTAAKPTPEGKLVAKLEKLLSKSQKKRDEIRARLDAQTAELKQIKAELKQARSLEKAAKAANR